MRTTATNEDRPAARQRLTDRIVDRTADHRVELTIVSALLGAWIVLMVSGLAGSIDRAVDRSSVVSRPTLTSTVIVALAGGVLAGVGLVRARRVVALQHRDQIIDELTGLPDRHQLAVAFRHAVRRSAGSGGQVAVILIDLRDFKAINQMFGRNDGDLVMAAVAGRIRAELTADDHLVRLAGDEFAVVRALVDTVDELDDLAAQVLGALQIPFEIQTYTVQVGANLGLALVAPEANDLATALKHADMALYRAKLQGPNRYEIFEHSLQEQVSPAMIVDWLRTAFEERQLRLQYQPIFSLQKDSLVAVEALLRWEHPTEGALSPDVVLPALEDSGLIVEVGEWVVDEACRQARIWRDRSKSVAPPIIFVNISPKQLSAANFLTSVEASLERHGVEAGALCLELGSLTSLQQSSPAWMLLRECKALGLHLALDNFGDNESSYGLIRRLQLDYLKIGRQLTNARNATPHDDAIAKSVVALARELRFTIVAEGVEDPASLERVTALGCDLAQGFYFGTAEPPEAIDQLITAARTPARVGTAPR